MGSLEKLVKAFEALKIFQPGSGPEELLKKKDVVISRKDKITNCNLVSDCICSNNVRNVPDFPKFLGLAMEMYLMLCDDVESDVRMVADECLNKTIKTLLETNLGRLQVELYKEIKKNGPSRCVRAALWRFADMCHFIRPQKCRPYIVNLLPCITRLCQRSEEAVQETLATSMTKLSPVLMSFANDTEIRVLLKAFLPNLSSSSATTRRTAAQCLTLICQYSRKPDLCLSLLLTSLLDLVLPVDDNKNVSTIVGVLLALRHMMGVIPHTSDESNAIKHQQLIQVYQLLLYHVSHTDHNVITASLETLQQLLKHGPPSLLQTLITDNAEMTSCIFSSEIPAKHAESHTDLRLTSVSDDTMFDDEQCLESIAIAPSASIPPSSIPTSTVPTSTVPTTSSSQTSDQKTDNNASDDDTADDVSIEELDTGDGADMLCTEGNIDNYANIQIGSINNGSQSDSSSVENSTVDASPAIIHDTTLKPSDSNDQFNEEYVEDTTAEAMDGSVTGIGIPSGSVLRSGDIGTILDSDTAPLVYCVRLISSKLLLTGYPQGLIADKLVRVSVKTLALSCVGLAVALKPQIFLMPLYVYEEGIQDDPVQYISELVLFTSHLDPQLKGTAALTIGHFIKAALIHSTGDFDAWIEQIAPYNKFQLSNLVDYLLVILESDLSLANRLALVALRSCFAYILHSKLCHLGLSIILALLKVKDNRYWLVKVELLEFLGELDYKVICYLEHVARHLLPNNHYLGFLKLQEYIVEQVIVKLLGDENSKVRIAAASTLVRIIPQLFYSVDCLQQDPVITTAHHDSVKHLNPIMQEWATSSTEPMTLGAVRPFIDQQSSAHIYKHTPTCGASLSRVVALVVNTLTLSTSRHLTSGCCHTLRVLSEEYNIIQYASSWCCNTQANKSHHNLLGRSMSVTSTSSVSSLLSTVSLDDLSSQGAGGALAGVLSLLTSTMSAMDLSTHTDALQLCANLFTGAAYKCMQSVDGTKETQWPGLANRMLVPLADQLFCHIARMLNVCAHIIDEVTPSAPQSKTTLPSLPNPPSLSPIKRKAKGLKDDSATQSNNTTEKEKAKAAAKAEKEKELEKNRKDGLGTFYNITHYMKIYDVLKGAYSNYKTSLNLGSLDKFGNLLQTVLYSLAQVLEVCSLADVGKYSDELLSYLKSTVMLDATNTILCVQQLLKALFGTNMSSQYETSNNGSNDCKPGKATRLTSALRPGLYHCCVTAPYTQFTQCLASATFRAAAHSEQDDNNSLLGWLRKKGERKVPAVLKPNSKADKASIASYIRLFEPLVIKALKQYTVSSCLLLQQQVLDLLSQLVQLRVNYCLLDSDQIFIAFVIKQFEYIEEGQIRNSETLIPHIFHFLVLLSYERYHSKTIIGMPKIIQLCDGIIASGQQPSTHAIPALQPIIHDLFVLRGGVKGEASKDLETQREVVVSMLLRLNQYYQVLEMLTLVLQQSRRDSEEKWKRLSRQVTDIVLPQLAALNVNINCQSAVDAIHHLFESVAPSVFRPVDTLLQYLLAKPPRLETSEDLEHWLALVIIVMRILIVQSKEEVVLSRLQQLRLTVKLHDASEASSGPPELTLARFLLQTIGLISHALAKQSNDLLLCKQNYTFLYEQLARLLLYITHMLQSGLYRRVATCAMSLISPTCSVTCDIYTVANINEAFTTIGHSHPTLTLQWCNILMLLNYKNQQWWKYMLCTQLSSQSVVENCVELRSCNREVVRQGALILFCDYVCENLSDTEDIDWVTSNHICDIIELSHEPPVQDFISAIQRNECASSKLIQAIYSNCDIITKPRIIIKLLHCLESMHTSQSGLLLKLLIEKYLNTNHLTIAKQCDIILCRRIETLLADNNQEFKSQLLEEELDKLIHVMSNPVLTKRHSRLISLLNKLQESCMGKSPTHTDNIAELHPILTKTQSADIIMTKEWLSHITQYQCCTVGSNTRECAQLLSSLDYSTIRNITMEKDFQLSVLQACIALGVELTRQLPGNHKSSQSGAESESEGCGLTFAPLLQAAQLALFRHINTVINQLPVPHTTVKDPNIIVNGAGAQTSTFTDTLSGLYNNPAWLSTVYNLSDALLQYLIAIIQLNTVDNIPDECITDICRFSVLCLEVMYWCISKNKCPTSHRLQLSLQLYNSLLQIPKLHSIVDQHSTWICSTIKIIHQILTALLTLPGENLVTLPNYSHNEELPNKNNSSTDLDETILACDSISELLASLHVHLSSLQECRQKLVLFVLPTIRNIIILLSRTSLVNSYARTPPLVWKLGWMPSPTQDTPHSVPHIPLDYLQEKDILTDFIYRVNSIGWINRQQFEETWMSLLGVLNPVSMDEDTPISAEEDIERTQSVVLAIQGITTLLLQTQLTPQPGNPANSIVEHWPRDKPLAFLHTKNGKKLAHVRSLIEAELQTIAHIRQDFESDRNNTPPVHKSVQLQPYIHQNIERYLNNGDYNLGQISVESIWILVDMLDLTPPAPVHSPSDTSGTESSNEGTDKSEQLVQLSSMTRPSTTSGLDIHSCLQFLLELYGQFLSTNMSTRMPLMQLNETIRSTLVLSDLFTEKSQFDWMLDALLQVHKTHPLEDEITLQYLITGVCKSTAVCGMNAGTAERVIKLLECGYRSTYLPCRVAALYGTLYVLEAGNNEATHQIILISTEYIMRQIGNITQVINSDQHVILMWSVMFYTLENFQDQVKDTDLTAKALQCAIHCISSPEEMTPLCVYMVLLRGLERLMLADVLTENDVDNLVKVSIDRLCLPNTQRAVGALGLMMTCVYSDKCKFAGKHKDGWLTTGNHDQSDQHHILSDPESLIVAMERVTVLFDRIKKGYPYEARVLTRVLPSFLTDFFPPQDIMNKVIGEFLSSQQPHPQLMAKVVFKVFEHLLRTDQQTLVRDWVMLSLSNFTQRTPTSMAVWSLTCFFVSASCNSWLRALFPHVVNRMGRLSVLDRRLFCIAALDFRRQLGSNANHQKAFQATFQSIAQPDSPYADLVALCT